MANEITLKIIDIQGTGECSYGHKVNDNFKLDEDRGKICSAAYNALYPYITGLKYGASFPWEKDKDSITLCCPDYKNPVVFKMTRKKINEN